MYNGTTNGILLKILEDFMGKKKKNISVKKKFLNRLGKVGISLVSAGLIVGSAGAADVGDTVIGAKGGKAALNEALKVARSKPALSVAAGITCIACVPVAGAAASPGLCIACGILIAKVIG